MAAADDELRFQLLSDVHLEMTLVEDRFEHLVVRGDYDVVALPPARRLKCLARTVVLLGDICTMHTLDRLDSFCALLKDQGFARIIYVPGNHEYYSSTIVARDIDGRLRDRCAQISSSLGVEVLFLNKDTYDPPESPDYRIAGCVLWHQVPDIAREAVLKSVACFKCITIELATPTTPRVGHTIEGAVEWNRDHAAWLASELQRAKSDGKKLIVLTHYKPTLKWPARHRLNPRLASRAYDPKNLISFAFQSDTDHLLDPSVVKAWCYGHDHTSIAQLDEQGRPAFVVNGVPLFSNQVGYISKGEEREMLGGMNEGFNGQFVWSPRLELTNS